MFIHIPLFNRAKHSFVECGFARKPFRMLRDFIQMRYGDTTIIEVRN